MTAQTNVLLIEDDFNYAYAIRELLMHAHAAAPQLQNVGSLEEAMRHLAHGNYEAVLLDLNLPDSRGLDTFLRIHDVVPDVPILVLTALADEGVALRAMENGAQDYLFKGAFEGDLLIRAINYAQVRQQIRVDLERELKEMRNQLEETADEPEVDPATNYVPDVERLGARAPRDYARLVASYTRVLERSIERWIYKADHDLAPALLKLADRLGQLRVTPRDVIDIHTTALQTKVRDQAPEITKAYVDEGRLLALQLMGYLAAFYRNGYLEEGARVEIQKGGEQP